MLAVRVADDELLIVLLLVRRGVSEVEELEDGVCVPVGDPVALVEAVTLEESDTLGVMDAEAPTVTDAVGVREFDAASVLVLEGVANADPDDVGDGLLVPESDGVTLDVIEVESETVPELEGLAPLVRLAVGDFDCVLERLCVELAVDDDVGVPEVVLELEPVCEGVAGGVDEALCDAVDVGDEDSDRDGVALAEPPIDWVVDGDAVTVAERLSDVDPLSLPDGVCVGVRESEAVPDPVEVTVLVGVDVSVIVVEPVPLLEPVFDELAPMVTEAVGVRVSDRERLDVELGVIDDVPVPDSVEVTELVGVEERVIVVEPVPLSVPELDALAPVVPGVRACVCVNVTVCNDTLEQV
jgi:hypothetical protein